MVDDAKGFWKNKLLTKQGAINALALYFDRVVVTSEMAIWRPDKSLPTSRLPVPHTYAVGLEARANRFVLQIGFKEYGTLGYSFVPLQDALENQILKISHHQGFDHAMVACYALAVTASGWPDLWDVLGRDSIAGIFESARGNGFRNIIVAAIHRDVPKAFWRLHPSLQRVDGVMRRGPDINLVPTPYCS